MPNKKFKPKDLLEDDVPFGKSVSDKVVGNTRWSIIHEVIFKRDGKFWRTNYRVGATESQDESPWEYEDEVECEEVELKEVTVKKWVKV